MALRTANDVAEMESEITLLRSESESMRAQLEITTAERDRLRRDLALAHARAQDELIRATQIETIMSQVSMGLVAGLNKMKAERRLLEADAEAEQAVQPRAAAPAQIDAPKHPRDLDAPAGPAGRSVVGSDDADPEYERPRQTLREENGLSDEPPAFLRNRALPDAPPARPGQLRNVVDSRMPAPALGFNADEDEQHG